MFIFGNYVFPNLKFYLWTFFERLIKLFTLTILLTFIKLFQLTKIAHCLINVHKVLLKDI